MQQWIIEDDRVRSLGEVPYLGVPYEEIISGRRAILPDDFKGTLPFMRMCYSVGDLGIVSGIYQAMKEKWPNMKIAVPSMNYVDHIMGRGIEQWRYSRDVSPYENIVSILNNNPYIDIVFNVGDFKRVFTDHDRAYTGLVHDGTTVRSKDEPLAEQILRNFGFTDEDIKNIDSRPKLYFSEEEVEFGDSIIKEQIGSYDYGCLLFASRIDKLKGRWEDDSMLYKDAERLSNTPVFAYSSFDISKTEFGEFFPNVIDFTKLGLTIRQQLYIKWKAKFNLGYQAGITDAVAGGGSENIVLCPYPTIRENCIRGTKYHFLDGTTKQF